MGEERKRIGESSWKPLDRATVEAWSALQCRLCGMGRRRKLYDRIVGGQSDANIPFEQTVNMLKAMRFAERIRGSHHIFTREGVVEPINLQDVGGECVPYQVKQMRLVLKKYNLREEL
jgi:hypothetical protein